MAAYTILVLLRPAQTETDGPLPGYEFLLVRNARRGDKWELPGGRCVSLLHRGPYDELGRSYQRVFEYLEGKGLKPALPTREVYLKGPGMIFRGNPKRYLTEILLPIGGKGSA